MAYKGEKRRYLKADNIADIVNNKRERNNFTFRIEPDGSYYYLVEGNKVSESDFNTMLPIDAVMISKKGNNPNEAKLIR